MKAQRSSSFVRAVSAAVISLLLMVFVAVGSASAESPLSVDSQITDKAGVLGADQARVEASLKRFTDKTGHQLYVVYVTSFDGLEGADWARKTAAKSTIGATDILVAISTSDSHYGVAVPRDHALSEREFSSVAQTYIRPAVNTGDWAGAATGASKGFQQAYEDSGLPWILIVIGIVVILSAGALIVHRSRRRYDETHEIRDEHGQPVDPLELLRTHDLVDKAQLAVAAVEDPALKVALAQQLSDLLRADDNREVRRALAIDIIHHSTLNPDTTSTDTASAGARP